MNINNENTERMAADIRAAALALAEGCPDEPGDGASASAPEFAPVKALAALAGRARIPRGAAPALRALAAEVASDLRWTRSLAAGTAREDWQAAERAGALALAEGLAEGTSPMTLGNISGLITDAWGVLAESGAAWLLVAEAAGAAVPRERP